MYFAFLFLGHTFPTTFARTVFLSDLFDVIIIALFVYTALFLFKQTRSFRILGGIGIMLLLYVIAQVFGLGLTVALLRYFFGFFLVVFVVVFQEELRRFFELLTVVSSRQKKSRPIAIASPASEAILQSIAYFSHNKIGSLIILPGEEQIERYLEGGEMLDGVISEDVMVSIFDPTSPGHDGAMILNKNRIEKFGVHLPLSNNFREIGKHGTRHSAALGIAERSDALALVVSEESGMMSLAQNGSLKEVKSLEELELRLNKFLREKLPDDYANSFTDIIRYNMWEKVAALAIAILLKLLSIG